MSNPASMSSTAVNFVIDPGSPGVTQTISVGANGTTANGGSGGPVLSATGRFVAFSWAATNLIIPNTQFEEVYVRDTCLGVSGCTPSTQLVSAVTGESLEGNGPIYATPSISISKQGRFVGSMSQATNLITPNAANAQGFMRDTCADTQGSCSPTTVLAYASEEHTWRLKSGRDEVGE